MGYKVITIERPEGFYGAHKIPKEIEVIFTWSKPRLDQGHQTVTSCLLRHNLKQLGIGMSVENLNDERDELVGMRWAFKRAIISMLKSIEYENDYKFWKTWKNKRDVESIFRKVLWEAMNGDN